MAKIILNIVCLIEKLIDSFLSKDRTGLVIAAVRLVRLPLAAVQVAAGPLRGQQAVTVSASLASAAAPVRLVVSIRRVKYFCVLRGMKYFYVLKGMKGLKYLHISYPK